MLHDTSCRLAPRRSRIPLLTSLAGALLVALPLMAPADYLKFLKSSPLAYFKQNDYELMKQNAHDVLESTARHAKSEWMNPQTGSSGIAEVRGEFTNTDGVLCKRLRVVNRAGGLDGEATYAVCKYAGRGWILHPDAKPAKPEEE